MLIIPCVHTFVLPSLKCPNQGILWEGFTIICYWGWGLVGHNWGQDLGGREPIPPRLCTSDIKRMCGPAVNGVQPLTLTMITNMRWQDLSLISRLSPALFFWPQYPKTYTEVKNLVSYRTWEEVCWSIWLWCHFKLLIALGHMCGQENAAGDTLGTRLARSSALAVKMMAAVLVHRRAWVDYSSDLHLIYLCLWNN